MSDMMDLKTTCLFARWLRDGGGNVRQIAVMFHLFGMPDFAVAKILHSEDGLDLSLPETALALMHGLRRPLSEVVFPIGLATGYHLSVPTWRLLIERSKK